MSTSSSTTAPTVEREHVYPDASFTADERQKFWSAYLDARTGTYEFRCRRYDAVIARLRGMGMRQADTILDIGAGRMEFAKRLRESGHRGMYVPIDGSIDGTDLNEWQPSDHVDWVVAIETIEHVHEPNRLLAYMKVAARFGIVVTTPNPEAVDVMAMDPTHLVPVSADDLHRAGYEAHATSLFTDVDDTLLGWFDHDHYARSERSMSSVTAE